MPHVPGTAAVAILLGRAREALGLTQNELAETLGVARRTVNRWEGKESTPAVDQLRQLARAVYAKDRALAADIAAEGNATLEGLGLVERTGGAPGASRVDPSSAPPRPFPPIDLMIDSVVHVASQALAAQLHGDEPVLRVRAALRAAFERARGLGLTLEEVAAALATVVEHVPADTRTRSPKHE
jgi:transcriptional regulator with XRE-family HTH domain